jgi:hypothetical protein
MLRTALLMLIAGLVLVAVNGSAQAAPIPPLAAGITANVSDVTDVSSVGVGETAGGAGIVARVGEIAGAACAVGDFRRCCGDGWVQLGRLSLAASGFGGG